jgi:hypothetical protein
LQNFADFITKLAPRRLADAFREIVQRKKDTKELRSRDDVMAEIDRLQRLAEGVAAFTPAFKRREIPQTVTKIRSEEHFNDPMEEALLDINVLYDYANQLHEVLRAHRQVHQGDFARIDAAIAQLAQAVQSFLESLDNDTYTTVLHQGFDRDRNLAELGERAVIDVQSQHLQLAPYKRRRLHELRGSNPTTVSTSSLTPVGTVASFASFKPERAIDPDPASFWASVFMTDSPVETIYDNTAYPGVLIEYILTLPYVDSINEIKLTPFGPFPIGVVDLLVWTDSSGWSTFNGFTAVDPEFKTYKWVGVPEWVKKIKFVLQQETYKSVDYLLPKYLVSKQNMWTQIAEPEVRLVVEDSDLSDRQKLVSGFDSSYNIYLEGLRRLSEQLGEVELEPVLGEQNHTTKRFVDVATQVMAPGEDKPRHLMVKHLTGEDADPSDSTMVRMTATEYVVGAYSIEVNHTEYMKDCRYVSPKYKSPGTLETIVFDATVGSPSNADGWHPTSVEYEIEIAEGRSIQVVPESINTATDESIFIHPRTLTGTTRFAAALPPNLTLRANGKTVDPTLYTNTDLTFADTRQVVELVQGVWKKNTRFTVTYDLDSVFVNHPSKVDITDYLNSSPVEEKFEATDEQGQLKLTYNPYVVYEIINDDDFDRDVNGASKWNYIGTTYVLYDGHYYSHLVAELDATVSSTIGTISMDNHTGIGGGAGSVMIENEMITYTSINGGHDLLGCTRGAGNSVAAEHRLGTPVVGERTYAPIEVLVSGVEAKNITDYENSQHPVFTQGSKDSQVLEFIQIGNLLYFSFPVAAGEIVVKYSTLAKYVQLKARLRANTIQRALYTPLIDSYLIKMKHTTL